MKVLFVTQYGVLAASSRTRVFQYFPYLAQQNICVSVVTVLPDWAIGGSQIQVSRAKWRKFTYYLWASWRTFSCSLRSWWAALSCDVLFIQKVIFPPPVRWLLRWRRPPVIYDFDDAIFTTEVRQGNWLARWKERRNARGLPAMLRLADGVVVENEYTAGFAATYCERITTITGPIDTQRYCATAPDGPGDEVVLGWIGSQSTMPYLDLIKDPLSRLLRRYPQVRLLVIGAEVDAWDGIEVETRPWSLDGEVEELRRFDVGLMPIPDDPWTRGKGGYKLLQYMAMGLPVVSSPVGVNRQIVRHGESGFWAEGETEWEDALVRLIEDRSLRREMGRSGRQWVERQYALDTSSRRLVELLREVAP